MERNPWHLPACGGPISELDGCHLPSKVTALIQPFALMAVEGDLWLVEGRGGRGRWLPGGCVLLVGYQVRLGRPAALETGRMLAFFLPFFLASGLPHCLLETAGLFRERDFGGVQGY